MRKLLAAVGVIGLYLAPLQAQSGQTKQSENDTSTPKSTTTEKVSGNFPDAGRVDPKPIDCGDSIVKLAPSFLAPVSSICPIINAALPLFAKRDKTKVAPQIPYFEDDTRFYVPLVTSVADRKGRPIYVPFGEKVTTVNDFYSIGVNGSRPKIGIALDYIKSNGGSVQVAPTTIGDDKTSNSVPWIAAIISFVVKSIRPNPLKGFKKYDVVFFVAPGADLYKTRVDHICFNPKRSGIKDCLNAKDL